MATKKENDTNEQNLTHAVHDELAKLGKEFARFNERIRKLESHSKRINDDIAAVRAVSEKISARFASLKANKAKKLG